MKWLNSLDALMVASESPNVHLHTLKVAVIELDKKCRKFDIESFRNEIRARLLFLDPLCYQLINIPFNIHHPIWQEHCQVDLRYHIRPWRLPEPGGRRELDEAIGEIGSTPLAHDRPLWEMYFVEGLAGNKIAVVGKIHHALMDGIGASNLMALAMGLHPAPDVGPRPPDRLPPKRQLIGLAIADHFRHRNRIPKAISYTVKSLVRIRRSPYKFSTILRRPCPSRPTFMNHLLTSPKRRFAMATVPLAAAKATCNHFGITINELVLAMSTGALRTLLLRYDGKAQPVLAVIPVSLDMSADRISGNYADALSIALPADVDDPIERLKACRQSAMSSKERQRLRGPKLSNYWLDCAPPLIAKGFISLASSPIATGRMPNLTISNVPGPVERGRIGGGLVTDIYSVGHLAPWSGLNITVWSYCDQLNISVLTDDSTVKDPYEVTDAILSEFKNIGHRAGVDEPSATASGKRA
ncbi:WS/DGAT/MGAT family O-acyltransferase [Mycobacterium marinum]|uniref:WS/DGAT/MGAT family O-acyltransferase n=1 Tax=Mycobacterium marinum TaxID=1781 RepID=UPI001921F364|nr:wax ester/triacylglycerol synthase family O-acyltransferase [Mycobacterium marinum]